MSETDRKATFDVDREFDAMVKKLRNPIKATYSTSNKQPRISVGRSGACMLCPATYSLTKHHIFGAKESITARVCRNCHHMLHNEVDNGHAGPFTRHMFQALAQVFPVTAPLPDGSPL